MSKTVWAYMAIVGALCAAGCSPPDQPMPLTSAAVESAIAPPSMEVLRVQARCIRHPLLAPVEISAVGGITPDQAAVLAVLANPSLRAVRDARGLAAAQLIQAKVLPNPTLTFPNEFPIGGPDTTNGFVFGLTWEISALFSYRAKVAAAMAQASSVDLDVAWQEWQVAQSAKTAAWSVLSLELQLEVARQADSLLRDNLGIVAKAVELGQKTAVDLSAAQAAQQESQTTVLAAERELLKQRLALNRLLGMPPWARLELRDGSVVGVNAPAAEELQRGLEDRRLDLLALRRGYDSQEATVRAAILTGFVPKTSIGPTGGLDISGTRLVGFDFSVDLPIFDRNQGQIAIEKATRRRLFDEFTNRVFQGRADIASAVAEIESLNRQIAAGDSAVKALQRLVEDYHQAVNAGNADVLSYYSAVGELNKKKLDVIKLKQELIGAWIGLENASGMSLTQGPRTPPASGPAVKGALP